MLKDHIVVDAHLDLLADIYEKRLVGEENIIKKYHLPDFIKGEVNIIVSSIFISNNYLPEMALRVALDQISMFYQELENLKGKVMLCRNYSDIEKAIENDIIGIMLSFEGVEPIGNDLNLLKIFYELGVRFVGLTWSRRNYAADGSFFMPKIEGKRGGLTDFGVKVLKESEKLGMIIDVSHLNDEGFWDVIKFSSNPIIASHSNVREIFNSMRNLTDEQIKSIAETGGVIGINANGSFVSDSPDENNVEGLVRHIDYISNLVGVEYVGLGFDFCDMFRNEPRDTLKGYHEMDKFVETLIKHGYNSKEIKNILGDNFLRLYKNMF
ncbi:membrane dipeptidase [Marinitoga sp. 1154]|nr:membrane dipeptidase [Marinitoga sp. 1154]